MAESSGPGKLDHLESVRGLAALAVVVFHLLHPFGPDLLSTDPAVLPTQPAAVQVFTRTPLRILYNGTAAVWVFFALSGVVLSCAFFRRGDPGALPAAAARRYPRLAVPVLAAVLFAWALQEAGLYANVEAGDLAASPIHWLQAFYRTPPDLGRALREGLHGAFFTDSFDFYRSYNSVLWTMGVELKGSFLVYAFLALFGRLRNRWVAYLAVGWALRRDPYMLDFLGGIALCDAFVLAERSGRSGRAVRIGAALAVVAGVVLASQMLLPGLSELERRLLPKSRDYRLMAGAVLLIGGVLFSPGLRRALSARPFIFLGAVSFPLYLLHFPLLCSLTSRLYLALRGGGWSHVPTALAASALSLPVMLAAAWLMTRFIDGPSVRLGKAVCDRLFLRREPAPVPTPTAEARRQAA